MLRGMPKGRSVLLAVANAKLSTSVSGNCWSRRHSAFGDLASFHSTLWHALDALQLDAVSLSSVFFDSSSFLSSRSLARRASCFGILSSPRSDPSSRSPPSEATPRAQRSLSPSSSAASPTKTRPHYGSHLLSLPDSGSAPGAAAASSGLSPLGAAAASPDTSYQRRGSRSSILASATEAASSAAANSDRESIRSAGSSSRAGPSTPKQEARRYSRNDEPERNGSPVSFYSSFEAPLTSPRQSRQGSMQAEYARSPHHPRSSSPTQSAAAYYAASTPLSKHAGNPQSPPSRAKYTPSSSNSTRAAPDRAAKERSQPASSSNRLTSVERNSITNGSKVASHPVQTLAPYARHPTSSASKAGPLHSRDSTADQSRPGAVDPVGSNARSISTSRSTLSFLHLGESASARPRSKSTASSTKSAKVPASTGAPSSSSGPVTPQDPLPSFSRDSKPLGPVPSKPSFRSRIFGSKSPKVASPITPTFDSGADTPSPRSARFPSSIHSQESCSDPNLLDHSDSQSIEPAMPSPLYASSSIGHARDDDDNLSEAAWEEPRDNASTGRKSSGASSFLRKTMRFKDKSAFLKTRPSLSSMASDPAAPASTSVPPSPREPLSGSDMEDHAKKQSSYKQVSGRRGPHYRQTSSDQLDFANTVSSKHRSPLPPRDGLQTQSASQSHDDSILLPPVTENDLDTPRKLHRSLSHRLTQGSSQHAATSPTSVLRSDGESASGRDANAITRFAPSPIEAGAQRPISRSSSLRGSFGRSILADALSPQISSDQAATSPLRNPTTGGTPHPRPRSGSAHAFAPQIQPRTTSSPVQSPTRRPTTAQGSPSMAASSYASPKPTDRPTQRSSRPRTADTGHAYSGSLSSLRDILMVAHAISEEGAIYHTPPKTEVERFDSSASPSTASKTATSLSETRRPGLPPKNPLRKQRPSGASVVSTPSISGHSPALPSTTGVFPGPSMSTAAVERPVGLASRASGPMSPVSHSSSTTSLIEFQTPPSDAAQLSPIARQNANDYFRPRELAASLDTPEGAPRSPRLAHDTRGDSVSPMQASFGSAQQLSRAPSSGSASARRSDRHERSASDATSSLTDLRSPLGPGASTTSLHSESSSSTKKKKEGTGTKMFAFARSRDGSGDQGTALTSSGTFRLGRSSKSKKADTATRPVIRRLYDGPLESEAAASAFGQASEFGSNLPHSPLQPTGGASPASSVFDYQAMAGAAPRTPSMSSHRAAADLIRSASSSGSTARDLLTPGSGHLITPQLGNLDTGIALTRSPSFVAPAWSIPQDDLSPDQKRLAKRWFVLRELLETERAYASDLAVARDIYLARAKMGTGITTPLSPLSVRSASLISQLTSPEPFAQGRSSHPHLQQRESASGPSQAAGMPSGRSPLPQRKLFRNASADGAGHAALAGPGSTNQTTSSASLMSSNPSNRSSLYTVSSQSSQTSDASQFALSGHPAFAGGLPTHFSIDGNALSPAAGQKLSAGTPNTGLSAGVSPLSSTPATPSLSTTSGILSPGFAGSAEGLATGASDPAFTAADVRIVFAQLESCAAFADEMVAVLEAAVGRICNGTAEDARQLLIEDKVMEGLETDRVGQAFLRLMPRIEQVYTAYCSRHEASMAKLQELQSTHPRVSAFLSQCTLAARAYTNAWDLSSLLIKPVQRVLKYPLLLSQILSSTSQEHPDHESLSAASLEIQKVADNINEVKKRKDLVEQIVSGKTTKRNASQRMQHGATKKLLRRHEKVKQLVLGPAEDILADDGQYKELVAQFRQLEKATSTFARRCTNWSTSVKNAHVAQIQLLNQWCSTYAIDGMVADTEAEARVRAFVQLIDTTFLGEHWAQLDAEIRTSLTPALQRIALLFALPQSVVMKRDDREPDYTRYRAEVARGGSKAVDKKLTESATVFIALHTQLMNELPQFNYGVQTLLDICIESLSRTQASYHVRVYESLISFWQTHGPEGNTDIASNDETVEKSMRHVNPVKIFWPLHSSIAGFAESLGIVSGVLDGSRSRNASVSMDSELLTVGNLSPSSTTHFSPLQSARSLPDSEFASKVPDASSMSQKIESITAAGSEELLEPVSARASPSPLATPPLGSHQRSGLSPQLHQQSLLGSPAPIGAQQQSTQPAAPRTAKSGGGFIGLLRSVGSSSAVGSRKTSQSTDAATESFADGLNSDPPTPISKDTPNLADSATSDAAAPPPTLPALTFNSGFFGQSDAVFTSASGHGLGVQTEDGATTTEQADIPMATMAAVANSGSRTSSDNKNGHPFVEYAVGDLFRVMHHDSVHLFGESEHGATGWVERENFVPLS